MISVFVIMQTILTSLLEKLPPQGLTFYRFYDKFSPVRGCEKDMLSRRSLREKPVGARLCKLRRKIPLWSRGAEMLCRVRPLTRQ